MKKNRMSLVAPALVVMLLTLIVHPAPVCSQGITKDPVRVKSCEEFNKYAMETGVTVVVDGKRIHRPGKAGSTGDLEGAEVMRGEESKQTVAEQSFRCNCNKKLYTRATTCLKDCKVSLRCFTDICSPVQNAKRVCLSTTFKVAFTLQTQSYRLDWRPVTAIPTACKAERDAWNKRVETHEQHHVSDAQEVVKEANDAWKQGKTLKACGTTEAEARRELEKQVKQLNVEVDDALAQTRADIKKRSRHFDNSSSEKPLDCTQC